MVENAFVPERSEPWNLAKVYSQTHIQEPLDECQQLLKICLFGTLEFGMCNKISSNEVNENKVEALNRLLQNLKTIIDNSNFMVDKKEKEVQNTIEKKLNEVEAVIDSVSREGVNSLNKQRIIELNYEHYNNCLRVLRQCLREIKVSVKRFLTISTDELDIEKIKQDIIDGG